MKNFTKIMSLFLALTLLLCFPVGASAAPFDEAVIDMDRKGSLTIYKYDLTNAEKDGIWDSSYVSTGVMDQAGVVDILGGSNRAGDNDSASDLGNGQTSNSYAIRGVEFTYLKIADICQFSQAEEDAPDHVQVLYAIDKSQGEVFLSALGLSNGAKRFERADSLDANRYFYESDTLIDALAGGLSSNSTVVKNALESYVNTQGGVKMPLTDGYGKTGATGLDLGLYLVVETKVPEMVVSTCDPFLVSLPMTSVNGTNASDGGTRWMYDVTLYPKNLTGIPSLEKTLREQVSDTGKNGGSASNIKDGYAHTGTASDGDIIDYQIISTLPSITSESTYLSCYTFVDTLSAGLSYLTGDVKMELFTDTSCTDLITTWREADGMFTVRYNAASNGANAMTIEMTTRGLAELNASKVVYSGASMVNSGYSDCTVRITYQAKLDSDSSVIYGDSGNPNEVVLTWKRTSQNYYDTLVYDAHVYTYGIDVTKLFSDGKGDFSKVEFLVKNKTDNYFVKAELNQADGVYYVVGHATSEADATHFIPVDSKGTPGKVIIKGVEDDEYIITEVRTDNGYTLLKEAITVAISQKASSQLCDCYSRDALGLIQNDPRYASIIQDSGSLHNIPQRHLEHALLTAAATVDGNSVSMLSDGNSKNAEAPLSVVNTRGFDLPKTGDNGTMFITVTGIVMMAAAVVVIILATRKKNKR